MTRYAFILATTLSLSNLSMAAPCCGGTANVPSLISGDDRTQLTATISSVNVVAEAGVGGGIKDRSGSDHEAAQTIRLDTATLLTDRLQAGITLPITRRSRSRGNNDVDATGLGDVAISIGYEVLPEWNYSAWRPRGLLFIATTIPTGGSICDASKLYRIDSRGRGFYTLGAGTLLTKAFGNWDTSLLFEGHRAFPRSLNNELGVLRLVPGWGASGMASVGYSPWGGSFRLGLTVAPSLEDPVATEGVFTGEGAKTVLWNASAQISYMASEDISMSAIYSDQTLLGGSENSALNRAVAFLIQKRWGR